MTTGEMTPGTLYLLPCPISDTTSPAEVLPAANFEVMRGLDYFIVENIRTARRFLSAAGMKPIDRFEFVELSEHTRPEEVEAMLVPLSAGRSAGVISEAGVPAVADPGAPVVAAAHRKGIRVVPLVGPSSILLALMASGANGQSFAFNGYLPVKGPERTKAIRFFERRAATERQSQIFIETPYRSEKLFAELLAVCAPETRLTVAADITGRPAIAGSATTEPSRGESPSTQPSGPGSATPENSSNENPVAEKAGTGEFIKTASIAEWRRSSARKARAADPNPASGPGKRPTIFILN